jgi:solute carrier family 1 (high affinity glutamate transporter) protein 1
VKQLKDNILLLLTVISVIFGIGLGFILRANTNFSPPVKNYFGFPGEIFLRSLKFLILPLISSSLITGIAGLGTQKTGKVAARALIFYFCSTFSAVVVGLILVSTIKPGYLNRNTVYKNKIDPLANQKVNTIDTLFDLIRNLFPENMVEMTFQLYQTQLQPQYKKVYHEHNATDFNSTLAGMMNSSVINASNKTNYTLEIDYYKPSPSYRRGLDVLGLVVFCITFGAVLAQMGEKGKVMVTFFEALNEASIRIIRLVMWSVLKSPLILVIDLF